MKKITLIVGAGVNREINNLIDLGPDLLNDIGDRVTDITTPHPKDKYLSKLLNKINICESIRESFVKDLHRYKTYSEYASIDDFLHKIETLSEFEKYKTEYLKIAKISIIFHVLGFEGSATKKNITRDIKNGETWFKLLCKYIQNNVFDSQNINLNIVTFNYDRILEQYLLETFNKEDKILDFINENVFHVYGRIGCFDNLIPRSFNGIMEKLIPFGLPNDQIHTINEVTNQINLIYEEREVNHAIKKIIKESDEILIMGYGFDYTNNIKIGLDKLAGQTNVKVALYPDNDPRLTKNSKEKKIKSFFENATIEYNTCSEFFKKHLFSLNIV
jgi:hypothetical protein